jgi:Cu/Ag efflux protein CusF
MVSKRVLVSVRRQPRIRTSLLLVTSIVFGLLLAGCSATRKATEEQRQPIQEIVQHPHSKKTAFNQAKRWAAQNFNSANEVIQEEDEEAGTLIMKGLEPVKNVSGGVMTPTYDVSYTLTLDIRDKKMRITFEPGAPENGALRRGMVKNLKEFYRKQLRPSLLQDVRQTDTF